MVVQVNDTRDIQSICEEKRKSEKRRLNNTNQYEREREREKKRIFFSRFVRFCSSRQTRTMMSYFQANEHDTSC